MTFYNTFKGASLALLSLSLLFPVASHAAKRSSIDNSPLQGTDEFPIIFYSVHDTDVDFDRVKRWGATHVHSYAMGRSIAKSQEFYDRASRHGLKVMANLDGKRRVLKDNGIEPMREYVNHFKTHPALGFWYLVDEPQGSVEPAQLKPFYEMLKEESPDVLVANAHLWGKDWQLFDKVQDVLMNDIYPVTGAPFPKSDLQNQTKYTRTALAYPNPVVPVLQIMNWKAFAKEGQKKLRGYPLSELRYPNDKEMRYMCFSSIAMGVKGLSFFSYARALETDPHWAEETLVPVIKEVVEFEKAIGYPKVQRVELEQRSEGMIIGLWENEGAKWMIAVNATAEPLTLSHSLTPELRNGKFEPWGATRETTGIVKGGRLSVKFEPWEVFIWKIQGR